jgi:N-carbamoyl-L-amino-acid hydrolase
MDTMDQALREAVEQARGRHAGRIGFHLEQIWYAPPVAFDPACVAAVRDAALAQGLSAREIISGAGHDAVYMARVVPTAMIFVPCKDGVSHNEAEYASPEACADGANILLHAVLARAGA